MFTYAEPAEVATYLEEIGVESGTLLALWSQLPRIHIQEAVAVLR